MIRGALDTIHDHKSRLLLTFQPSYYVLVGSGIRALAGFLERGAFARWIQRAGSTGSPLGHLKFAWIETSPQLFSGTLFPFGFGWLPH